MVMGHPAVSTHWFEIFTELIYILVLFPWLFFFFCSKLFWHTIFSLPSNTDLPMNYLIVIILVVQKLYFVVQDCGEWRFGGGGGGGGKVGALNSVLSAALPKQQCLAAIQILFSL